jgi:hypothetical protein
MRSWVQWGNDFTTFFSRVGVVNCCKQAITLTTREGCWAVVERGCQTNHDSVFLRSQFSTVRASSSLNVGAPFFIIFMNQSISSGSVG